MVTMDSEEVLRETNTPISRMVILMFQEGCDSFERASVIPSGVCFLCDHVSLWEEERKELAILTWHRSTHWHALNTRHDRCLKESTARGFIPERRHEGCLYLVERSERPSGLRIVATLSPCPEICPTVECRRSAEEPWTSSEKVRMRNITSLTTPDFG